MEKDQDYYRQLMLRWIRSESSPREAQEIMDYLQKDSSAKLLLQSLREEFQSALSADSHVDPEMGDRVRNRLLDAIDTTPVKSLRFKWLRAAAAAILLIGAGAVVYMLLRPKVKEESITLVETTAQKGIDVAPGSNKATLTLADGTRVELGDQTANMLPKQGNVSIINNEGKLVYNNDPSNPTGPVYNTLTSARGQSYSLVLADGSKLWLNAASSVRFPVAFSGNDRHVEITGEVYFEIAKDAAKPFSVKANNMQIEVLGTHFNINAYADEAAVTTTLLEGSVKVNTNDKELQLQPGQQSRLLANGNLQLLKNVNTEEIVAWKNGYFHFESADLRSILRQFSRWYDIEVVYEGELTNRTFFAIINRSSSLANVLKMLNANNINFTIEERKLIVKPG